MVASLVVVACRAALMVVFGVAVVGKVRTRHGWQDYVRSLEPVIAGRAVRAPLAGLLVVTEAAIATAMAVSGAVVAGFAAAAIVLAGFVAVLGTLRRRRVTVTCRCFGTTGTEIGRAHIAVDAGLAALACAGLACEWVSHAAAPSLGPAVLAAGVGAWLGLLAVRVDDVVFALTRAPVPTAP